LLKQQLINRHTGNNIDITFSTIAIDYIIHAIDRYHTMLVELYLSVNKMNDNNDDNNNNNESSAESKEKGEATVVRNSTIPSLLKILKDMLYIEYCKRKKRYTRPRT
jgi:hypothetical protein